MGGLDAVSTMVVGSRGAAAHTAITADGPAQPTAWEGPGARAPEAALSGRSQPYLQLGDHARLGVIAALFWCTSLLASIFVELETRPCPRCVLEDYHLESRSESTPYDRSQPQAGSNTWVLWFCPTPYADIQSDRKYCPRHLLTLPYPLLKSH